MSNTLPAQNAITNAPDQGTQKTNFENQRDVISSLMGGAPESELTLSSGTVTPPTRDGGGQYTLDTEGDASTDDLASIGTTNIPDGQFILIRAEDGARDVVVKHAAGGAGQIHLNDNVDLTLNQTDILLCLRRRGADWFEVWRDYGNNKLEHLQYIGVDNHVNRNLIINGDLNAWQESTSFAAIADAVHFADLWAYNKSGAMVHTVSRATDVPSVAESGHLSNYAMLIDCTTMDASLAASDFAGITLPIEGYDFLPYAQRPFVISFWHKHTKTGTYCVGLRNAGRDRSFVGEYTQAVADAWEVATIVVSASPAAGTWDTTNGVGLEVVFTIASGTDRQASAASVWESGNFMATANQVNAADSTANNMRFAQLKIDQGPVALPFVGEPIADTLARINRYLFFHTPSASQTQDLIGSGHMSSGTSALVHLIFPAPLRNALYSLVVSNVTHFAIRGGLQGIIATTGLTVSQRNVYGCRLVPTSATGTDGESVLLIFDNANATLLIDARL